MRWKVITSDRRSVIAYRSSLEIHYPEGGIVEGIPGTLGIMCFEKKKQAEKFMALLEISIGRLSFHKDSIFPLRIIRVKPFGSGVRPRLVFDSINDAIRFFNHNEYEDMLTYYERIINELGIKHISTFHRYLVPASPGTICYKKVKVLD